MFEVIHAGAASLRGARFSGRLRVAPDGDARRRVSHAGEDEGYAACSARDRPLEAPTAAAQAVVTCSVAPAEDLRTTSEFPAGKSEAVRAARREGIRTRLAAPLMRGEEAVGVIAAYRREARPLSLEEIALPPPVAAHAVIAIENVRRFKAQERLNAELGGHVVSQAVSRRRRGRGAGGVEAQVGELERMGRLERFLSPQAAQTIPSSGDEAKLTSHRALAAVLFADIRGFTAFCESAEPEETLEVLQTCHEEMGRLPHAHGAGVDHRSGDGVMAIFNDPLPSEAPAGDAVRLAVAMRARMRALRRGRRKLGHRLGFAGGAPLGCATAGMVGSEGRCGGAASGASVKLGARLCDPAADGEAPPSPRAALAVEDDFAAEPAGEIDVAGLREPVDAVRRLDPAP